MKFSTEYVKQIKSTKRNWNPKKIKILFHEANQNKCIAITENYY